MINLVMPYVDVYTEAVVISVCINPGEGGTAIYGLYGYVPL